MDAEAINAVVHNIKGAELKEFDDEHAIALLPPGFSAVDISKYMPPPDRIKQRVELLNVESLVAYVLRYKVTDSVIFANEDAASYQAVIDYHEESGAHLNCDHIASYLCPRSDQWNVWTSLSGKARTQVELARFIEDNLPDVVRPVGADMMKIVLQLQVHKAANFQSETRLDNGEVQFRYEETIRGASKVGDLSIPDSFQIGIPVFVDGPRYPINCRLRYRLDEGKLSMWYELERPAEVFRVAVKEVTASIKKDLPDLPFWIGKRA